MVKASEKLANGSQTEISQQAFSSRRIFEAIINFFTEDDWAYTKIQGEQTLRLAFQGQNGKWTCYAKAREQQQQFVFYSICPIKVPETKNLAIAEFIARANFGMIIGNFELDFTDGEIRYKTSIDVEGANLTFLQIKRLVYANVMMMDQYLPGMMSVIDSDVEPKDAIAQIESQPEEFSAAKTCSAVKGQLSCSTSSLQDRYCENSCGMGILPVQVMQFKCGIAYPLGNRINRKLDQVPGELVIPWECQINLVS
jgi:hypothetical protein